MCNVRIIISIKTFTVGWKMYSQSILIFNNFMHSRLLFISTVVLFAAVVAQILSSLSAV